MTLIEPQHSAVLAAVFCRPPVSQTTGQLVIPDDDQPRIRFQDISLSQVAVIGGFRLTEALEPGNQAILGFPTARAPSTMLKAMLNREIQRRPVHAA